MNTRVAIQNVRPARYPDAPPFDPPNAVYDSVCATLVGLGLDLEHAGRPSWNPFGHWVRPGGSIVIKPNFVTNRDREKLLDGDELFASSTHPAVLRPLIDLAWRALDGRGRLCIVDSPIEGSDIEDTKRRLGFDAMLAALQQRGVRVEWLDLRDFGFRRHFVVDDVRVAGRSWNIGWLEHQRLPGDPRGYTRIDLGDASFLDGIAHGERLAFHKRDYAVAARAHRNGAHPYSIANTILDADLVVNVPKLKTHKKTGVTLALKSAIGLSNRKIWMPHFRRGWPPHGDEFDRQPSFGERLGNRLTNFALWGGHTAIVNVPRLGRPPAYAEGGCHPGNTTLWRTVLDLNVAVVYGTRDGRILDTPQRHFLHLIDGIVGGEGDGPLRAVPRAAGVLLASTDAVALEAVGAEVMGFDSRRLPTVTEAAHARRHPLGTGDLEQIEIVGGPLHAVTPPFKPPRAWSVLLRDRAAAGAAA